LVPTIFKVGKVGGDASHGSRGVVAPMMQTDRQTDTPIALAGTPTGYKVTINKPTQPGCVGTPPH